MISMIAGIEAGGVELGFENTHPSPLEPKKLNFYCTLGLAGEFKRHGFAAEFASYNIDNQLFRWKMEVAGSINKNNGYKFKNFQFCPKISKNGGVISNYFQVFSKNFQVISNYFQQISNSAGAMRLKASGGKRGFK